MSSQGPATEFDFSDGALHPHRLTGKDSGRYLKEQYELREGGTDMLTT